MALSEVPPPVAGGWYGSKLATDPASWRMALPVEVRDDLLRAAAGMPSGDPYQQRPAVSERTRELAAELYRRLAGVPGMVVLSGVPVEEDPELIERLYLLLGTLVGMPVRQTLDGRMLLRVEILDKDVKVPGAQNVGIPSALPFHIDRATDLIGLLCIRSAQAGGLSLVVSSKTVHNILGERHPELLSALYEPFPTHVPPYRVPEGERAERWCEVPPFSRFGEHFAAYCDRTIIERSQLFPDAPRVTERQWAALDAVDEVVDTPGLRLEMALEPGDLQLINNLTVLHSRTAYGNEPSGRGRLLLRQHLAFGGSPALPYEYTALFGASAAGTYRGGLWRTADIQDRLGAPLQAA